MISRIFWGETENVAIKRKKQIDTLKIFNDNVVELKADVEYRVEFDAGDTRMAIMVVLSPEFPMEKPELRVLPPVNHPWCNDRSEITSAPGLLNFTVHSDLGRVVQAIIREFSKNPPWFQDDITLTSNSSNRDLPERGGLPYTMQSYGDHPSTSYNAFYNSQISSPSTNSEYTYNFGKPCAIDNQTFISSLQSSVLSHSNLPLGHVNPDIPMRTTVIEFPELNKLSSDELQTLKENSANLEAFLEEHSQLRDMNLAIDEVIDYVEKLASENLMKETELMALQSEVASKVQSVAVFKARYDGLIQQYNKLSGVFAPDHIKECLKRAADESHEKSERIAEDFVSGKMDVERFLSTYIRCRKLGQARRTKEEKLAHQLDELKRAGY